ncbi:MAG: hypothetical protein ACLFTT_18555 [Candidatus Hydrogenedentota bacterium]
MWPLVAGGRFTGYSALIDFGVVSGLVRYLAQHAARGASGRLPNLVAGGAAGVGFGLRYTVMLRWLPLLDAFDVHLLEHTLRLGKLRSFQRMTRHMPR